jgi:hypothetical protein
MIERKPDINTVTRAARSEICPHCPLRWGPDRASLDEPSVCELQCDLFKHLPIIRRVAACADPMMEPVARRTAAEIAERVPAYDKRHSPLWRNRRRLIAFVTRLFGG